MPRRWTFLFTQMLLTITFLFSAYSQEYILLGWNDLGMHCSNKDFSKVVVLPPYNNITAQLILKNPDQLPQIVSSGYTIEYSIPNNTYSVGKTNFWTYAQQLFGLSSPLPPNIGLTGKGLTGVLDSSGSYFAAHGIPVTPFADSDLVNEAPFQLIHLVAKSTASGTVLATTDVVIPVSNEVGCVQSGCHASETAILNAHESVSGFNKSGPVLCASCHASNALGTTGNPEAGPFSLRIHEKHSGIAGPETAISTCYKCHPGPKTQCLRDIMGKNPTSPMICQNCHGTMANVAATVESGRRPWLDEPKCGNCHGSYYTEQTGKLYRQSTGHGGLFCSACHGSPHAILPTVEANDNLQNIRLQGVAGTLRNCSVCHATPPSGAGPHGIVDTTSFQPATPLLLSPVSGGIGITTSPLVHWNPATNAQSYSLQVSSDSLFSIVVSEESLLTQTSVQLSGLNGNQTYYWRVRSKNSNGYSAWSTIWHFTTTSGLTFAYTVNNSWNLISLPLIVDNPRVDIQFPSLVSNLYEYVPGSGYVARDSLAVGKGYWLKFFSQQSVHLTGVPVSSETVNVIEGWNLIGSISDSVPVTGLTTIPGGLLTTSVFGYQSSYTVADVIAPLKGYWVKANSSGSIILSKPLKSIALNGTMSISDDYRSSNSLTIRDAEEHQQVLYVANRTTIRRPASAFELPPLPPEGIFDARFVSNHLVELYDPGSYSEFMVQILSANYPVTVALNWKDEDCSAVLRVGKTQWNLSSMSPVLIENPDAPISIIISSTKTTPSEYSLSQNYPNPFNPVTKIDYQLPVDGWVSLRVFDMLGREIETLVEGNQRAGSHSVEFTSDRLPSGIYMYKMTSGSFTGAKKMVILR
jgi:hypothetical protein